MPLLRKIAVGVAIAGLWFAATVLGLSAAALRTPVGRRVVVDWGVRVANAWLQGSLTVGEVGGSFFRGLEIHDLSVRAQDGSPVITADMVGLQYGVLDLLKGRLVFGSLRLVRPEMAVVQYGSGEPLNLVALVPAGDSGGGPSPLVAFGRVSITGGSVVVMAPAGADSVLERVAGPLGDLQVRRLEGFEGDLGYLRVVSPDPDAPILVEFERLRTTISDPALDVRDLRGTVQLWGDSVALDLSAFVLPETQGRVEGLVRWPDGPLLLDLRGQVSPGRTDDLLGLVPGLPAGLVGDALFSVRSVGEDVVEFATTSLDLRGQGGGEMRGALGMRLGPGERWTFEATDLDFTRFDLEYFRGFLDTLPFAGRLTGRVAVTGPAERLQLTVDGTFFDYTVAERPVSSVLGAGYVSLAGDDFVFERFHVEQADIALATVRRLVPSVILKGRLWASGMLDGSWLNATFDGGLEYADPPLPRSEARGVVRLDSRADTVGTWATLTLDSLRLESFHSSFSGFELVGSWGGRLELSGFLSALSIDADLEGPAGSLRGSGVITALEDRKSADDVRIEMHAFDLERLKPTLPRTRLDGHVEGAGGWDRRVGVDVAGRLALGASTLSGVAVEHAAAWLALTDSVLKVDSLDVTGYGIEGRATGAIAMAGDRRDTLTFTASSDSIGALESIVASWLGAVEGVENGSRPTGVVQVSGRVVGSLDAFQLVADVDASRIRRGDLYVSHGGGTAAWVSSTATLRLDGVVDSLALGALALGRLQIQLHGRRDSLQWQGRSRIGFGAWLGGGTWMTGPSTSTLGVDSLVLSLFSGPWLADRGAIVTLADSALTFQDLRLRALRGPGTVTVGGRWPFRGPGALDVMVDAFPVADVMVLALRDPYEASGELNGTLSLVGTARSPIVDMGVSLRDGAYRDFRAPYTQGVLHYRDRELTGDLELWRQGQQMLKVTLTLPLDLALAGAERRRLPGPIRLRARADSVQLALFEAITPSVRALGGRLDADFGIEGTWENPELAGSLVVHDGAATLPALGVRHEAMNGSFRLAGDTIGVENLSVRSGTGTVDVRGFVRLEELSRPVLDLHIVADVFRALDLPGFLTLTASGDVALRGPLFQARLTGQGTATQGVLYFADLLRKDIVNLEDTLFAQFVDTTLLRRQGLETRLENRFLDSLRIDDMRVEMGRDFWMRSSEANVQLGGAVLVNKVRDRYRLDGTLQALRGTYRLQMGLGTSREFAVTRGEIRYLGTPDLNADLDIDARHEVRSTRGEDVAVFVNIGGSLYDPRLTLTSDIRPALSEPEIISYLLFGAPTLAAGASQSGFGSRLVTQQIFGVLSSQIEYSLITDLGVPLDYIQIRPTTTLGGLSGAEFALGKQFRVFGTTAFLTASPRICRRERFSLEPGAGLEFRLNRSWIVSASVDPLTSCEVASAGTATHYQFGADLFWEKRY